MNHGRLTSIRSPLGSIRNDPNSPAQDHGNGESSVYWEEDCTKGGDTISPLRYDNSYENSSEMYRHKENLHAQLKQSFSPQKNKIIGSVSKIVSNVEMKLQTQSSNVLGKLPPKGRATVVSARRVISTRITHQVIIIYYIVLVILNF